MSSLRAFEAVARRLSFSKAAEELHVTPGAVSQQIRSLEELLGERLFERTKRSVALTAMGSRLLPDIQAGLEMLARAMGGRTPSRGGSTLAVSVAPSFASKWLLPRLGEFSNRHPDIELRISATAALADFKRDGVDVAIRLGSGYYPDLHVEPLFAEGLTPMCSPELPKRNGRLEEPDDLRNHKLLHDTSIPGDSKQSSWERWLSFAGAKHVAAQHGDRFSLAELAMQAAMDGAGVVLGRLVLAERDLAEGRLIAPFDIVLPLDVSYFLVMPRASLQRREVECFKTWLYGTLSHSRCDRNPRTSA